MKKNNSMKKHVMNNERAPERAVALMHQAIDVIRRIEQVPVTPVGRFLPEHLRRELRRNAKRLRQHKAEPRYASLHSAEELAELYERTVLRDEILEQARRELDGISRELKAIADAPEVRHAVGMLVLEAEMAAELHGPGSEAAERFRLMAMLADRGHQHLSDHQRQRSQPPSGTHPGADLSLEALQQAAAADLLVTPPPGAPVLSFPPEGQDSGRGRMLFRIGLREASWIGSFERGEIKKNTVRVLPDRKHLFVCAEGAGYVIELQSRTLVHTTGTQITGVMYDNPVTLFIVKHDDTSLEVFGRNGRLWKTDPISTGGFRGIEMTEDSLVGEARHPLGWARFSVGMETGVVVMGDVRGE